LLALLGHPAPLGSATMATAPLLRLRLDALEQGSRPAVPLARGRLVVSVVLVVALLATAAWLPRYPPSRMVRSAPATVMGVQPCDVFQFWFSHGNLRPPKTCPFQRA